MTDSEKAKSPPKALAGTAHPESPTTARPLDFDDDPQEAGVVTATPTTTTTSKPQSHLGSSDEAPPPKPPRPVSPREEAENTLKEAFPDVDATVIRAVLVASAGNVERAFHALLGMSDPNAQQEDLPPIKPPRPSMQPTSTTQTQLEADEMYARQLAEHYGGTGQPRQRSQESGWDNEPRLPRPRQQTGLKPNELYDDRDHSFFEDDLPVIKENIRKGFLETQTRVNTWVQNFKKKLDGEEEEGNEYGYGQHQPRPTQQGYTQGYGENPNYRARRSGEVRRSADHNRYDADPQVLGDDFSALDMRDNEGQPRSTRPLANPNLFKKSPSRSPDPRKVSFQDGPPEEISGPRPASHTPPPAGKSSKWQPLSAVDPSPVGDNDPFSLGDSDDEKEAKNKDLKPDEAERLKQATAEAMAGDIGADAKKGGDEAKDNKLATGGS
ncbi:hypothetical protein AJ80_04238 [Polytolypa hystricis UAMH7299]|uniref:CUE domain-containing protein n=1 Tax=Polytolypa hystricis (strain UAMH7299) TaxID=1447883 RepID=A0A2B7YE27_POLH7|nr:hypothetical protein AJ80_04238 [Polytolypa hystricis UAMH7299]